MSRSSDVAFVKKVLNKYVDVHERPSTPKSASTAWVMLDFGKSQAAVLYTDTNMCGGWFCSGIDSIDGIIGGFNVHAPDAANAAASLGLISEEAASSFCDWFRNLDRSLSRWRELNAAKLVLDQRGYTVTKKRSK